MEEKREGKNGKRRKKKRRKKGYHPLHIP